MEIIRSIPGFFLSYFVAFSYVLKALEKLYLVRTEDQSFIGELKMQKKDGSVKFQTKSVQVPPKY